MSDPVSDVVIRPAEPGDVPAILGLIKELAAYERLSGDVVATERDLESTLFGPQAAAEAVLAETSTGAEGLAIFFTNYSTFLGRPGLYLEDLFVRPEARGQGIGRALFTHVARLAVERQCGRMEWAVLNWNTPAIEFYQRQGARPLDEWTTYRVAGEELARLARDA